MERILFLAVLLLTALFYLWYMRFHGASRRKALIKSVPGLLAFGYALFGVFRNGSAPGCLITFGLLACSIADYVLEFAFLPGIAAFAGAHVLFTAGFMLMEKAGLLQVLFFTLLFFTLFALFHRNRQKTPKQLPFLVFVLYAALLSLMAALSLSAGPWYAAGALLFVFSDGILGLRLFGIFRNRLLDWILMAAYYLALLFLAAGNCL